jgi:hypothetical protein
MPEMISIGCPSASRARSRKACLRREMRSALVPTTRTLARVHVAQALAEALEAGERARRGLLVEPAVRADTAAQAHHLAQPVDDDELAVRIARDHHVETGRSTAVRTEIDGRQDVGHGARSAGHKTVRPS